MKIGLCLSGGGSKGLWQSGCLRAWLDLGLQYDALYGSSVGSLNGTLLHQGDWDKINWLWMNVHNKDIYRSNWWGPFGLFTKSAALYDSSPLAGWIDKLLDYKKILDNPSRFYINAVDLKRWEPVTFESKMLTRPHLVQFLRASASPPVYVQPVEMFDMTLVDAGVMNNYCLAQAVKDKMDVIVSINFAQADPQPIRTVMDVLSQTLAASMYGYYKRERDGILIRNLIVNEANEDPPMREIIIVEIMPPKALGLALLDFEYRGIDRGELMKRGYDTAYPLLEELKCQIS